MTKSTMIKANSKELKLLDNLAKYYIQVMVTDDTYLIHTSNYVQIVQDIYNRSIKIVKSMVDNGANETKAYDYLNTFSSLARLIK